LQAATAWLFADVVIASQLDHRIDKTSGRIVMDVWIDNQNWTEEIWFAIAAAAVLAVLLYSIFRTHFWS
jgi:hypothetical protein